MNVEHDVTKRRGMRALRDPRRLSVFGSRADELRYDRLSAVWMLLATAVARGGGTAFATCRC